MWSCRACAIRIKLRIYWAFSGISSLRAFSTERTLAMACTVVHTPQNRCVNIHASRGSRPRRIFSIPRHMVHEAHALLTELLSTSTSMRRWPSILVMGSMVIRFAISSCQLVVAVRLGFVFAEVTVLEVSGPTDVRAPESEVARHVVPFVQRRGKDCEAFHRNQKTHDDQRDKAK